MNTRYNPTSINRLPRNGSRFIAPFSDDIDLRGTGQIYYRQTNDHSLLSRATREIQTAFSVSLNVSSLFIATWDAVGYYPRGTNGVRFSLYAMSQLLMSTSANICECKCKHLRECECNYS